MSIPSIKFRPRTVSNQKPILQCYISLYGVKAPKFSTQIRITDGLRWSQKSQVIEHTKEELKELAASKNAILIQMTSTVNNCFTHLTSVRKAVNANILKAEFERVWNKGSQKSLSLTLLKIYDTYLKEVNTKGFEPKTIEKYNKTKDHLIAFLKTKKRNDLEIEEIQPQFGFQFFEWIKTLDNPQRKGSKITAGTAKRHLLHLNGSMQFAFSKGLVNTNIFAEVNPRVKKAPTNKTIISEEKQLMIYRMEQLTITERFVADISTLMFYTAFDYCDLLNFNVKNNIIEIDGIKAIQKIRYKRRKAEAPETVTIPINNILEEILFVKYPDYFPIYTYNTVRRVYKNLCSRIGVKDFIRMSLKQIRKSSSSYYLNNDTPLKPLSSKILGHSKQSQTESTYVVVEDSTIIRHTKHLLNR